MIACGNAAKDTGRIPTYRGSETEVGGRVVLEQLRLAGVAVHHRHAPVASLRPDAKLLCKAKSVFILSRLRIGTRASLLGTPQVSPILQLLDGSGQWKKLPTSSSVTARFLQDIRSKWVPPMEDLGTLNGTCGRVEERFQCSAIRRNYGISCKTPDSSLHILL